MRLAPGQARPSPPILGTPERSASLPYGRDAAPLALKERAPLRRCPSSWAAGLEGVLLSHSGDSHQSPVIAPNWPIRSRPRRPARKSAIQAESPNRPTGPQSISCPIRAGRKAPIPGRPAHTFRESSSDGTGEPERSPAARRQSYGLIHAPFTALPSSRFRSITVQLRPLTHPRAFRTRTS